MDAPEDETYTFEVACRLVSGFTCYTGKLSVELATTRGCDARVPVHRWSLLVLISTTGGLALHDHDVSTQLVETVRGPEDPKGGDPRTDRFPFSSFPSVPPTVHLLLVALFALFILFNCSMVLPHVLLVLLSCFSCFLTCSLSVRFVSFLFISTSCFSMCFQCFPRFLVFSCTWQKHTF